MSICIIGAMSEKEHGVGFQNTIPWKQKADMDRFKNITQKDGIIILGLNTMNSFNGYVLPKRIHIVLTHIPMVSTDERIIYANSMFEAVEIGKKLIVEEKGKGISIIGGARVWAEGMHVADILHTTYVQTDETIQFDTFFPEIDMNMWVEKSREMFPADEKNQFAYAFVDYIRK